MRDYITQEVVSKAENNINEVLTAVKFNSVEGPKVGKQTRTSGPYYTIYQSGSQEGNWYSHTIETNGFNTYSRQFMGSQNISIADSADLVLVFGDYFGGRCHLARSVRATARDNNGNLLKNKYGHASRVNLTAYIDHSTNNFILRQSFITDDALPSSIASVIVDVFSGNSLTNCSPENPSFVGQSVASLDRSQVKASEKYYVYYLSNNWRGCVLAAQRLKCVSR